MDAVNFDLKNSTPADHGSKMFLNLSCMINEKSTVHELSNSITEGPEFSRENESTENMKCMANPLTKSLLQESSVVRKPLEDGKTVIQRTGLLGNNAMKSNGATESNSFMKENDEVLCVIKSHGDSDKNAGTDIESDAQGDKYNFLSLNFKCCTSSDKGDSKLLSSSNESNIDSVEQAGPLKFYESLINTDGRLDEVRKPTTSISSNSFGLIDTDSSNFTDSDYSTKSFKYSSSSENESSDDLFRPISVSSINSKTLVKSGMGKNGVIGNTDNSKTKYQDMLYSQNNLRSRVVASNTFKHESAELKGRLAHPKERFKYLQRNLKNNRNFPTISHMNESQCPKPSESSVNFTASANQHLNEARRILETLSAEISRSLDAVHKSSSVLIHTKTLSEFPFVRGLHKTSQTLNLDGRQNSEIVQHFAAIRSLQLDCLEIKKEIRSVSESLATECAVYDGKNVSRFTFPLHQYDVLGEKCDKLKLFCQNVERISSRQVDIFNQLNVFSQMIQLKFWLLESKDYLNTLKFALYIINEQLNLGFESFRPRS